MNLYELNQLLIPYQITANQITKVIDSSHGEEDYRLNVIFDHAYVLRINSSVAMSEKRLQEIEKLISRYQELDIRCPHYIRLCNGEFSYSADNRRIYLSEYIPEKTLDEMMKGKQLDDSAVERINKEAISTLGRLASVYSGKELSLIRSMWSIIDLAPLDNDVDEKQENCDLLCVELIKCGEHNLARRVKTYNEFNRREIEKVYKKLPRCMFQGDLNSSNILVKDGHFYGLIDFNLAGTEVNINCFLSETNGFEEEFILKLSPEEAWKRILNKQNQYLDLIFENYNLNDLEKKVFCYYQNIVLLFQYPNVMEMIHHLEQERDKACKFIDFVVTQREASYESRRA